MIAVCLSLLWLVLRTFLILSAVVVLIVFVVIRYNRSKTYHLLKEFPGYRESIPLMKQLTLYQNFKRTCDHMDIPFGVMAIQFGLSLLHSHVLRKHDVMATHLSGVPIVVPLKPKHFSKVLTHSSNHSKSVAYDFLSIAIGKKSLLLTSGDEWKKQRKMLTPTLHLKILEQFTIVMNRHAKILLSRFASKGADECIEPYLSAMTLDIASHALMGKSINAQGSDSGKQYLEYTRRGIKLLIDRGTNLLFWPDIIYKRTKSYQELQECVKVFQDFTVKQIEKRMKEIVEHPEQQTRVYEQGDIAIKSKKPFLDLLLQKHFEGEISLTELKNQVDTFIFAGHDTTSAALTYAIYLIGLHPNVQRKLHTEVDAIFGNTDDDVTFQHLAQLKYLDMVMKESQRIFPSVAGMARNLDEDIDFDGVVVPKGTEVILPLLVLHHDPDEFPKPLEFDPERFSPEQCSKRNPYSFIPFSAGPRNCIGQRFATLVEKIVLCWLLRRYKWASLDPQDTMMFSIEVVLRPVKNVRVVFEKRITTKMNT